MDEKLVREIQDRQTQVSRRLAQLQQQLFKLEDQYLEATQLRGNFARGWEGFLDYKVRGGGIPSGGTNKKERKIRASDRVCSFSSLTAPMPKTELDRDEDSELALKWADKYEQMLLQENAAESKAAETTAPLTRSSTPRNLNGNAKRSKMSQT